MFRNREDAGRHLAELLRAYRQAPATVVLGLPRGGVVVAAEVARALSLPLDVIVSAKVGAPGNPEFAAGAVAPDGVVTPNERAGFSAADISRSAEEVHQLVQRRLASFRAGRAPLALSGVTALVVDDGIATGLTMRAAVEYLRRQGAARVVVAAPVMAHDAKRTFESLADEVVAVQAPVDFWAVGQFYDDFGQTPDSEVIRLLAEEHQP